MLTIRTAQLRVLEEDRLGRFKRRLVAHFSDDAGRPGQIEELVERGVADAARYGLLLESQIVRFVDITRRRVPAYPDQPLPRGALAILTAFGLDGMIKLDRYEHWLVSHSRQGGANLG